MIAGVGIHTLSSDDGLVTHVSMATNPQVWMCVCITEKKSSNDVAETVNCTTMPSSILAACSTPSVGVAIAFANGSLRFFNLSTGLAANKSVKLEPLPDGASVSLACLGQSRVVLLRMSDPPTSLQFFIFIAETRGCELEHKGSLLVPDGAYGPLRGVSVLHVHEQDQSSKDRILLCWSSGSESKTEDFIFTSALLNCDEPKTIVLPRSPSKHGSTVAWACMGDYLIECVLGSSGLDLVLRDACLGMPTNFDVKVHELSDHNNHEKLHVAVAGSTAVLITAADGTGTVIQLSLPAFSLHMSIGARAWYLPKSEHDEMVVLRDKVELAVLQDLVSGKRMRDDPEVVGLFSKKARMITEEAVATAVKDRYWKPSHELLDVVVQCECREVALSLLRIPELDPDLAVRLLSCWPDLLAYIVARACTWAFLSSSLRNYLNVSRMPGILEVLLEWLDAYRRFPVEEIEKKAPGIPDVSSIVAFLSAFADGCLPSLARLDGDLLARVAEGIMRLEQDVTRAENLRACVQTCCHLEQFPGPTSAPVQVSLLRL